MLAFMAALDPRYGMYLNASGERSNIVNFALRGFFLVLLYLEYQKNASPEGRKYLYISAFCFLIGSIPQALAVRMTEYFVIANHYSIAKFPELFESKSRKLTAILCFAFFFMVFVRFANVNATFLKIYQFNWN